MERGATGRGIHTGDPHRGPTQRGGPHRGEGPTEDPPPEGRATQGTHTEHTQTRLTFQPLGNFSAGFRISEPSFEEAALQAKAHLGAK